MGKVSAEFPIFQKRYAFETRFLMYNSLQVTPCFGKLDIAKQACLKTDFLKALRFLRRWRRKIGSEQTGKSAARTLRRLSTDEFLDELLGRKFSFGDESRSGLDFAGT